MWTEPPAEISLGAAQVDVWRIDLEGASAACNDCFRTLSPDEVQRAQRFHFTRDRNHYVMARGALRAILGKYLSVSPAELSFNYSTYGKPGLAEYWQPSGLQFNVSHSHELALVAVMREAPVGVDLEWLRVDLAGEQIARRFFSPDEVKRLQSQPAEERTRAFFTCWTRKEAYIKGRGEGLSLPLDQFDVSFTPGQPAQLLATRPDAHEAQRWSLIHLDPGQGYVGALAAAAHSLHLRQWDWRPG